MFVAVRIKGEAGLTREVRDTLKMLRLDAPHSCVIVPQTPAYKGMLQKVKDTITYGETDKQTLAEVLRKRLRLNENAKIDENMLKDMVNFNSHDEFADALFEGKVKLSDYKKLHPVLRLSPPTKGFKSTESHYPEGDLGYRGNEINPLLRKMI